MQVFKTYFKILKSQLVPIAIYGVMFLALAILISSNTKVQNETYSGRRIDTMVINKDGESDLLQGFLKYLGTYINPVEPVEGDEALKDALFYHEAKYILTIPEGFSEAFENDGTVKLIKQTVPDYAGTAFVDNAIDNYFNIAKVYQKHVDGKNYKEMNRYVEEILKKQAKVEFAVKIQDAVSNSNGFNNGYFNPLAYIIVSIFITAVSIIMLSFHGVDIRRRHAASPILNRSLNVQLLLANLLFALAYLIIFITAGYVMNRNRMINDNTLLTWLNVLVFSITALSISYLIGITVKSRKAVSTIATALSLGLAFISGVFVPQELLAGPVKKFASFTPTYWYVKANNTIGACTSFGWKDISEILGYMGIQLGFAVAIISIALVVSKRKRQQAF